MMTNESRTTTRTASLYWAKASFKKSIRHYDDDDGDDDDDDNDNLLLQPRHYTHTLTKPINKLLLNWSSKLLLLLILALCSILIKVIDCTSGQTNSFGQDAYNPQTLEIVAARGFKSERYEIKSQDGTPLVIYHIINPLADPNTLIKYPMLMGHGFGGDSAHMLGNTEKSKPRKPLLNGEITIEEGDECLAVAYLNNNFDLWILESRGTNRNNHRVVADLDPLVGRVYFNYSLDEEALLDIPAFIDFVLDQTQMPKLMYTGYSESTSMMFALLSWRTDYQDKLISATLLAPVAYLDHLRGGFNNLMFFYYIPDDIMGSLLPEQVNDLMATGGRRLCSLKIAISEIVCQLAGRVFSGAGETDFSPGYFSSFVMGTSAKKFKHFLQWHVESRFGRYNYGPKGNMIAYGQLNPPDFDVSKIKLPTIILARGGNDFLSTPEDQVTLLKKLGTKPYLDIYVPTYNHLDLQFAMSVKETIQAPILKALYQILQQDALSTGLPYLRMVEPIKKTKPVLVVEPNQVRNSVPIQKKSNILTDIVVGLEQENFTKANPIINAQLAGIEGIAKKIDALTDEINTLPDQVMENPALKPLANMLSIQSLGLSPSLG